MNGCCTTDFQKKVSEFISSATCMVAKDNNDKRAIIVIAVEENEKGDMRIHKFLPLVRKKSWYMR